MQLLEKLTSVQGNSCSEKSHKLSGKHATESSFSEFVRKLWKLGSISKTYIRINNFPGNFQSINIVLGHIYSS